MLYEFLFFFDKFKCAYLLIIRPLPYDQYVRSNCTGDAKEIVVRLFNEWVNIPPQYQLYAQLLEKHTTIEATSTGKYICNKLR